MTKDPKGTSRLSPDDVVAAYTIGMFPMADPETGEISWYAPDPRGIIELDSVRAPRSLRRVLRSGSFEIRWNSAFRSTMRGCANRLETWISPAVEEAYVALYERGLAHSVECWLRDELVGGLYGVSLGGAFFGESMFSKKPDASKAALMHLVQRMNERGFALLDTQFLTDHLARFGGKAIPRSEYLSRLQHALTLHCTLHP